MFSSYNSINTNNASKTTQKRDENRSDKKYSFIGLLNGLLLSIIVIVSLKPVNNNNNKSPITPIVSHVNLQETAAHAQQKQVQLQQQQLGAVLETHAKSHDSLNNFINDNLEISSDSLYNSVEWDVKAKISDIASNDVVVIRNAVTSAILRNPSSSNRVKTLSQYDSNRNLWKVGGSSISGYTFRNLEDDCYLEQGNSVLKCISSSSPNAKAYWISGGTDELGGDDSSYQRHSTKLKNKETSECANAAIVGLFTETIPMSTSNCNEDGAGFQFEVMKIYTPPALVN